MILLFYLHTNFISDFNKLFSLFLVIMRFFLLKGDTFLVLKNAFLSVWKVHLSLNEFWKFLPILSALFSFKIIKFVITSERIDKTIAKGRYKLVLFLIYNVRIGIAKSTYCFFQSILHSSLASSKTLFSIIFLQEFNKRLIDSCILNLNYLSSRRFLLNFHHFRDYKLFFLF